MKRKFLTVFLSLILCLCTVGLVGCGLLGGDDGDGDGAKIPTSKSEIISLMQGKGYAVQEIPADALESMAYLGTTDAIAAIKNDDMLQVWWFDTAENANSYKALANANGGVYDGYYIVVSGNMVYMGSSQAIKDFTGKEPTTNGNGTNTEQGGSGTGSNNGDSNLGGSNTGSGSGSGSGDVVQIITDKDDIKAIFEDLGYTFEQIPEEELQEVAQHGVVDMMLAEKNGEQISWVWFDTLNNAETFYKGMAGEFVNSSVGFGIEGKMVYYATDKAWYDFTGKELPNSGSSDEVSGGNQLNPNNPSIVPTNIAEVESLLKNKGYQITFASADELGGEMSSEFHITAAMLAELDKEDIEIMWFETQEYAEYFFKSMMSQSNAEAKGVFGNMVVSGTSKAYFDLTGIEIFDGDSNSGSNGTGGAIIETKLPAIYDEAKEFISSKGYSIIEMSVAGEEFQTIGCVGAFSAAYSQNSNGNYMSVMAFKSEKQAQMYFETMMQAGGNMVHHISGCIVYYGTQLAFDQILGVNSGETNENEGSAGSNEGVSGENRPVDTVKPTSGTTIENMPQLQFSVEVFNAIQDLGVTTNWMTAETSGVLLSITGTKGQYGTEGFVFANVMWFKSEEEAQENYAKNPNDPEKGGFYTGIYQNMILSAGDQATLDMLETIFTK